MTGCKKKGSFYIKVALGRGEGEEKGNREKKESQSPKNIRPQCEGELVWSLKRPEKPSKPEKIPPAGRAYSKRRRKRYMNHTGKRRSVGQHLTPWGKARGGKKSVPPSGRKRKMNRKKNPGRREEVRKGMWLERIPLNKKGKKNEGKKNWGPVGPFWYHQGAKKKRKTPGPKSTTLWRGSFEDLQKLGKKMGVKKKKSKRCPGVTEGVGNSTP